MSGHDDRKSEREKGLEDNIVAMQGAILRDEEEKERLRKKVGALRCSLATQEMINKRLEDDVIHERQKVSRIVVAVRLFCSDVCDTGADVGGCCLAFECDDCPLCAALRQEKASTYPDTP